MSNLKCCKCNQPINGGCYNAPSGVHCCDCWDKVPQKVKDDDWAQTLRALATVGASVYKAENKK